LNGIAIFIFLILLFPGSGIAAESTQGENPFMAVRDRYQWGIEQVMAHKGIEPAQEETNQGGTSTKTAKARKPKTGDSIAEFKTQVYQFQTETDKAKLGVEVTDMGSSFIVDVTSDQVIEGWLLKRQSTRDVFLKGTAPSDNPYKCRIRVDRPYLKDFGLTVYVTQDSDPAFIQLF